MAGGKTFHGLGEIESAFRDDASDGEDVRGVYSGPTVVDDDKVEEGLKKLRSLDQPPGPLTGVTEVVVDSSSSAKTKIAELPAAGRPTAVGHSLGTPQVGQTIASDPLRGTMFGHSIHLPDVNSPDDVAEELSSGALMVTEPSAPHQLGPFPLADGATRPQGALGPRAEPLRPAADGLLPQAEPFRRPNKNFRIPEDTTDQLAVPRSRSAQRTAIAFVAAAVVAVGIVVWQQVREGEPDSGQVPAAATGGPAPGANPEPTAAAPAGAEGAPSPTAATPPSPAAAAQPARGPEPAGTAKPAAAPAAAAPASRSHSSSQTAAEPTEANEPGTTPPAAEEPAAATAPAANAATTAEDEPAAPKPSSRPSRRKGSRAAGGNDDADAPSRPSRTVKPKVEEDPDATLPPSLD